MGNKVLCLSWASLCSSRSLHDRPPHLHAEDLQQSPHGHPARATSRAPHSSPHRGDGDGPVECPQCHKSTTFKSLVEGLEARGGGRQDRIMPTLATRRRQQKGTHQMRRQQGPQMEAQVGGQQLLQRRQLRRRQLQRMHQMRRRRRWRTSARRWGHYPAPQSQMPRGPGREGVDVVPHKQ